MKRSIILTILMFLIISCAANAKKKKIKEPQWLKNPKAVYSDQMYLSAIGEGDSRSMAENMAAGNLARIFQSNIKAEETVSQRYLELTKNDEFHYEEQTDVSKNVNIQSEQTLFNIQFAESYTDKLGRVFVIAYLHRMKTGTIYEEKIAANSEKIVYYLSVAEGSGDRMVQYAAYNAATVFSIMNESLIEQLRIIFPNSADLMEKGYSHQEISKKAAEAAKEIGFRIIIQNDEDKKIEILIVEMLTDLGFMLKDDGLLQVDGLINIEKTDLKRDLEFVRFELQLELKDNMGNTIAALDEKGREGHISLPEAKARAIRTLQKKIKRNFSRKVTGYFDTLISKK